MPQPISFVPEQVDALLGGCGFRSIETHCETYDVIYESAEDWWAFQLTLALRLVILTMDEETRAWFKKEYLAKLYPLMGEDGLHLSVGMIYALARP